MASCITTPELIVGAIRFLDWRLWIADCDSEEKRTSASSGTSPRKRDAASSKVRSVFVNVCQISRSRYRVISPPTAEPVCAANDKRIGCPFAAWTARPTAATEPGQERGEIPQEERAGRAFVNFSPVDVRPRPLTDEPARDERALPDPRDPRGDEDGGRRTRPSVEDPELLGPPEHAADAPQRVAPED